MRNMGFRTLDEVVSVGPNSKMSEVSAAMGLTGLESIDEFIAVNRRHYEHYPHELTGIPGITLAPVSETERSNFQYVVLDVDEAHSGISRDDLIRVLTPKT